MGMIRAQDRTREFGKLAGVDLSLFENLDVEVSVLLDDPDLPDHPVVVRIEVIGLCGGGFFFDVSPTLGICRSGTTQDPSVFIDALPAG